MSAVHASRGPLKPASEHLRSEVDIVCSLALATLGDRYDLPWEDVPLRLHRDPAADRPGRARLRGVRREGRPARRLRAAAPAARLADVPDRARQGGLHGQPARRAARARGAAADADAALARPVQHHDLRPRRPLPRGVRRASRGLRPPRRHRPRSACTRTRSSTWSASGATGRSATPTGSGWWPTTSPGAARRRTTRRPTRWSRSTRPRSAATARRRSRSSCGSRPTGTAGADKGGGGAEGQDEGHKSRVEPEQLS